MPRFSANLGFLFTEHPFLDRLGAAARAGFRAVEIGDPYTYGAEAIAGRLAEHDLACALLNLPMGDRSQGDMGLACLPHRVAEFREGVARGVEMALALGCPRLNCMAGRQPAGADPAELRGTLIENVRFAARAFARAGLTVCLEALNTIDTPGFFLSGTAQVMDVIRDVGEDNVRLQLDLYHMHIMEGGLAATIARLLPHLGHVQFGDVPGRHEPGTGDVPFAALFAQLDGLGYAGWVGAEYRPSGRTEDSLGWLRAGDGEQR
jgi:hydroxypyruvate isomerase